MALSLLETERARNSGVSDEACVRSIAERVIRELEIVEPPIDVKMVASFLGIKTITKDRQLAEAGCLTSVSDLLQIRVRAGDSEPRQRFTICHECGHTFFPGFQRQTHFRCSPKPVHAAATNPLRASDAQQLERLCDVAASELLLPRQMFTAEVRSSVFALSSVATLATRYEASLEATARRFIAAQTDATALVILQVVQKPREFGTLAPEKLRVTSSHVSGSWPFLLRHKSANADGPFDRALQGELVHEMTVIDDLFASPVEVEVSAEACYYSAGGDVRPRVMALLRRHTN